MSISNNPTIILFNYGGGMRGLVPAHIMSRIEEATGLHMADMVDVFAGPSTGAILNTALNVPKRGIDPNDPAARPRLKAKHMVRFYKNEGIRIFPPDRFRSFRGFIHDFNNRTMKINQLNNLFKHGHYNPSHLSSSLKRLFGDHKLSDTLRSLIIPVYNIDGEQLTALEEKGDSEDSPVHTVNNFLDEGGHALWLKNIKLTRNAQPPPNILLRDAVMASCAAPTYFPCHHFEGTNTTTGQEFSYSGIDGCIFDNPCISWYGAIQQHVPDPRNTIMIGLGTGYTARSIKKEEWNSFGGLGVVDPENDLPLISILFHAPESALVGSFTQEMGNNLYMFNKSLISDTDDSAMPSSQIDDASPENLIRMENFAESIIEENQSQFHEICHHLVNNRDQKIRDKEDLWTSMKRRFYIMNPANH